MALQRDILLYDQILMYDTSITCVCVYVFVCYLFEIVAWRTRASTSGSGANPTLIYSPQPRDAREHASGIWEMSAGRWG